MLKFIKLLTNFIFNSIFKIIFKIRILKVKRGSKIWIIDIDNTIANTYPALLKKYPSHFNRLLNLKPFPNMREKIILAEKEGVHIFYLTVRNYIYFWVTYKWLSKNQFPISLTQLILLSNPIIKYELLSSIAHRYDITYFDDLSFNHENDQVIFYQEVINKVIELPISYIGYDNLIEINKEAENYNL